MAINGLMEGLGDFFQWTFKLLPLLGNIPNVIFILIGFLLFGLWMKMQTDFNRRAGREGRIK